MRLNMIITSALAPFPQELVMASADMDLAGMEPALP